MQEQAEALIRDVLAPLIEVDGGQIELVEVRDDALLLRLSGTCAGCPGQPFTIEQVIGPAVRKALGDHVAVVVEAAGPAGT